MTDAQVVLGRLDPEHFLGGDLAIDAALSHRAIDATIGAKLGLGTEAAALGILRIVNNSMALAINANSVAKGVDPRDFTLMGFGGAGPLHAVSLAEAIAAKDVISPVQPGITAATGLLVTDLQYEYTQSTPIVLDNPDAAALSAVNAALDALRRAADEQLDADGVPAEARRFRKLAECRYLGQGFELRAEMPEGPLTPGNLGTVVDSFFDAHSQVYGHAFKDQACEIITVRLIASVAVQPLRLAELPIGGRSDPDDAVMYRRRTVFDDGEARDTPRYARDRLKRDDRVHGPALIVQHNSTTLVPPGYVAAVMRFGDMLINRAAGGERA